MARASSGPIGDVDTVDIVGLRKDGGLDMVISCVAPIDDSPSTLRQLETKICNYIKGAKSEAFLGQYGCSVGAPVTVFVSCAHPIAAQAMDLIARLRTTAAENGIAIEVIRHMGDRR
jgi:hypothetical protein